MCKREKKEAPEEEKKKLANKNKKRPLFSLSTLFLSLRSLASILSPPANRIEKNRKKQLNSHTQ